MGAPRRVNTGSTEEGRERSTVPGAAQIKAQALRLGFDLAGITNLGRPDTAQAFDAWLASGFAGEMHYLDRTAELRRDARRPEPGMRSAVVVAMNYGGTQPPGAIARYARGDDYHEVMRAKLDELGRWFIAECDGEARTRSYVDTGPVLERDLARRAGLGWFGKNTNLINPGLGSFFFIGALFTDADLETDAPFEADRCGTCTRCLDACPTQAFTAPRVLDSTRCISYLTIELKGEIPAELRPAIGEHLYGCDICQDVCPWNRGVQKRRADDEPSAAGHVDLVTWLESDTLVDDFDRLYVPRNDPRFLRRNALIALGNVGGPEHIDVLERHADDEHAHWALDRVRERA